MPGDVGSVEVAGVLLQRALKLCRRCWLSVAAFTLIYGAFGTVALLTDRIALKLLFDLVVSPLTYGALLLVAAIDLAGPEATPPGLLTCLRGAALRLCLAHTITLLVYILALSLSNGLLLFGGWLLGNAGLAIGASLLGTATSYAGALLSAVLLVYVPAVALLEQGSLLQLFLRGFALQRWAWRELLWLLVPLHLGAALLADMVNIVLGTSRDQNSLTELWIHAAAMVLDAACTTVVYVWVRARLEGFGARQLQHQFELLAHAPGAKSVG